MLRYTNSLVKKRGRRLGRQGAYMGLISVLIISLVVLSNLLFMFYNESFYYREYAGLSVYESIPEEDAEAATWSMLDYLTGGSDELSSFFNEHEKLHLRDVKMLVFYGKLLLLVLLSSLILFSFLLYRKLKKEAGKSNNHNRLRKRVLNELLIKTTARILVLQGAIIWGVLAAVFFAKDVFEPMFLLFHILFFNNDLWLMNPSIDKIIILLPQQFFAHAVATILARSAIICGSLFVCGLIIWLYSINRTYHNQDKANV